MNTSQSGFTLVELMVAMVMAGIVSAVIYTAYNVQSKIYTEQDQVAEMQQNIRAGILYFQQELRMAGYGKWATEDRTCNAPGSSAAKAPGIHTVNYSSADTESGKESRVLGFSMDLNGNGDCADSGENVTYSLYKTDGMWKFGRKTCGDVKDEETGVVILNCGKLNNNDPIAENISNIDLLYLLSSSSGVQKQTRLPAGSEFDDVVAVQVTLLAESRTADREAASKATFTVPAPDWGTATAPLKWEYTDSMSRRMLVTTVNLRNLGL